MEKLYKHSITTLKISRSKIQKLSWLKCKLMSMKLTTHDLIHLAFVKLVCVFVMFIYRWFWLTLISIGDVVVANVSNKKKWAQPQNVTTTLSYPSSGGQGAFLTYILINCEQSSNLGRAYVTSGGVQQHYVQIVIESQVTTYFNYASFFYGIKWK